MIASVRLLACSAVAFACLGAADAAAQCCPQPQTVAYAPVAPPVYQQTVVQNTGWYPGKYLTDFTRNLFRPRTTTTYATGYAPAFSPTPYAAGYAPLATQQSVYRPTYPITYGPVVGGPMVQGVARPVTLAPLVQSPVVTSGYNACGTGCDACGGVSQAVFDAPLSSGCGSCGESSAYGGQPVFASPNTPLAPTPAEPQPMLGPNDNPPAERSFKPDLNDPNSGISTETDNASGDSGAYWQAPPLFDPRDRVTQKAAAPVWQAVYRKPATATRPTARPTATNRRGAHQLGAAGWGPVND
ncbi:MAG: hypothetical protein AAFV43_15185 [Planctomycetota bacterium]